MDETGRSMNEAASTVMAVPSSTEYPREGDMCARPDPTVAMTMLPKAAKPIIEPTQLHIQDSGVVRNSKSMHGRSVFLKNRQTLMPQSKLYHSYFLSLVPG